MILDDDAVTLSIDSQTVTEGDAGTVTASFTVSLSGPSAQAVTVDFTTADGSATSPADYAARSGTLTFAPGQLLQTIAVEVAGDELNEADESFTVNLSNATGNGVTIANAIGTGSIEDDDEVLISIDSQTVTEGDAGTQAMTFTVSLSGPSAQTITCDFTTVDATATSPDDFIAKALTVSFAPGVQAQTIQVDIVGDQVNEAHESFQVKLSNRTGNNVNFAPGAGAGVGIINDNDAITLSIANASVTEGDAGQVAMTFNATLSGPSAQDVRLDFATVDGSATAPADYAAGSGTLSFEPGTQSASFEVLVEGDTVNEADESFSFAFSNLFGTNVSLATTAVTGTINDDDDVTLSIDSQTVTEGDAGTVTATFTVSLSGPSAQAVSVDFATADGSAASPGDYIASSGQLDFAPGELNKTIAVAVVGDELNEADESFTVNLSNATGNNVTIATTTGIGSVEDDDLITLRIDGQTVTEGDAGTVTANFIVSLSGPSAQTITVDFTTIDGAATSPSDFVASSGQLTFAPGQQSKTIPIDIVGDLINEANEGFLVQLSDRTGNNVDYAPGAGVATGLILDNDAVTLSIDDQTVTEGDAGTVTASFTVTLSGPSEQTIAVNYRTEDGSAAAPADYVSNTSSLSFAPGELTQTIAVVVNGDTLNETDEDFIVRLLGNNGNKVTIADATGIGIIEDDDEVLISIDSQTVTEGDAGTQAMVFTVSLSGPSAQTITCDFTTVDATATSPDDFIAKALTVSFAPGVQAQTIQVDIVGDQVNEAHESFQVKLSNRTGNNVNFAPGAGAGVGIINDNDAITLSIANASVTEGDAGQVAMTFNATLSGPSAQDVRLDFATVDGSATAPADYAAGAGTVSFAPGTQSASFEILVEGDTINETDESFSFAFSNLFGTNVSLATTAVTGTINDNDDVVITLSPLDATIFENPDTGSNSQAFTVTLTAANGSATTTTEQSFSLVLADNGGTAQIGADAQLDVTSLSFAAGDAGPKSFTLTALADGVVEGEEVARVRASLQGTPRGVSPAFLDATATIIDGDNLANEQPSLDPIPDQVILEDAGPQTLEISGLSASGGSRYGTAKFGASRFTDETLQFDDESGQLLSLTAVSSDPSIIPDPTISGSGTSRTLSYAPLPDANGSVTITLTVTDDGGTDNGGVDTLVCSFTVTVTPVNDAPFFDTIAAQTVNEDSGTRTIALTGLTAGGGADEASQTLLFSALSSDPGIVGHPTITVNGATAELSFTPAAEAFGQVNVAVTLQDDGGSANGGTDTFISVFTITVNPVNDAPFFDAVADQTINEDAGPQSLTVTNLNAGGGPLESGQAVSLTAVSDNPTLIANPTVTTNGGSATLDYAPAAEASGTATITLTATDDGGTDNGGIDSFVRSFTITVNPVNDAPFFDPIADQVTEYNAGPQSLSVTGVDAGGAFEAGQVVSFTAVSSDPSVVANPEITGSGASRTLSYTPIKAGFVTVTVTAQDDGGTDNGGVDTFVRTFTITVNGANEQPVFDPIADQTILEDAGPQVVDITGIQAFAGSRYGTAVFGASRFTDPNSAFGNEALQNVNLTAFSSDPSIIPHPSITGSGDSRLLTYAPLPDANGFVTITVTAQDDGGTLNGGVDSFVFAFTVTVAPVNDAPSFDAVADQSVNEDSGPVVLTLTGLDSGGGFDEDAQVLSFAAVSSDPGIVGNPTVVVNGATAELSFFPAANAFGQVSINLVLSDDGGTANGGVDSFARSFTITVNSVNDAPFFDAVADQTINEDAGPQSLTVTNLNAGGGPLESGQAVSLTAVSDKPALIPNPTVTVNGGSATLDYTPTAEASGTATITLTATDDGGTANGGIDAFVRTFVITVNAVNDAPTLDPIADVTVDEDSGPGQITLTGLSNGGGPDEAGQVLSLAAESSDPSLLPNPTVLLNGATATLSFAPLADAFGQVTITVTATDDGGTANGGVDSVARSFTLSITAINDAPFFDPIADQVTEYNAGPQSVDITGVDAGGSFEAGQVVSLTAVSSDPAVVANPDITGAGASRTLSYTPIKAGFVTVTVTAQDDGGTANGGVDTFVRTFTITVNGANEQPVFDPIADQTILEDAGPQTVEITGIQAFAGSRYGTAIFGASRFTDPNSAFGDEASQSVVLTATSSDPSVIPDPSITGSGDSRQLTYAPLPDANGVVTITVTAMDDGGTLNGGVDSFVFEFTVTVTPVNDAPFFDTIAAQTVNEDSGTRTIALTGLTVGGGADENSQALLFSALSSDPGIVGHPTITVNGGTAELSFTPAAEAFGQVNVAVTLQDDGGSANGGTDTFISVFTITVNPVNDAPFFDAVADQTINEDAGPQSLTVTNLNAGGGPLESGQAVSLTAVSDNPALIANPTVTINGGSATLDYSPAAEASGTATITLTATDDGGTANGGIDSFVRSFTITVNAVNDAPSFDAIADQVTGLTDGSQSLTITGVDAGGAFEAGQAVTLTAVSSDPAVIPDPVISGAGATRDLSYEPASTGVVTITVTAQDDGGTANGGVDAFLRTFTITVNGINEQPVFDPIADRVILEDVGSQLVDITGIQAFAGSRYGTAVFGASRFTDPASVSGDEALQNVTLTAISSDPSIIPHPVITGDGASRTLTFAPLPDANGTVTITVTAQDDGGTNGGGVDSFVFAFTVTVTPVNDAPSFDAVADQAVAEDSGAAPIIITGLDAGGGADEDAQLLSLAAVSSDPGIVGHPGVVVNGDTAQLSFTPAADAFGQVTINLTLSDDGGTDNGGIDSFAGSFTITVSPVNDAPSFDAVADQTINEDAGPQSLTVTNLNAGGGPLESGQAVSLTAVSENPALIANPIVTINGGSATLDYAPAAEAFGSATITLTAADDGGTDNGGIDSFVRSFTITVNPVNDAPSFDAIADQVATAGSGSQTVDVTNINAGGGAAEAGQVVALSAVSDSPAVVDNPVVSGSGASQSLSYIPLSAGSAVITVTATDDGGTANGGVDTFVRTFTITVNGQPPEAPSELLASALGATDVALSWTDNADDETGFRIERSPSGQGNFLAIATVAADVTFFTDASAQALTSYDYRVFALKAGIDSAASNIASAATTDAPLISTIAGNGSAGFSGDGGPATSAQLNNPNRPRVNAAGDVFVTESTNHIVRRIDGQTGLISTYAGTPQQNGNQGDGGPATAARMNVPAGLAIDALGNIAIGTFNNRVRYVDANTGAISVIAGNGVAASTGDGGPATAASINIPIGLAFDAAGNLYISDNSGHRVRRVDVATGIITTVAGNGIAATSGDGGPATAASLNAPSELFLDDAGKLYITEDSGDRLRRVDLATGIITTVAGSTQGSFGGDGGPATEARFDSVNGVVIDELGTIYVTDRVNHRIRRIDAATGIITTIAGDGTNASTGDGGPADDAQLAFPSSLAIDIAGRLLFCESSSHRVRRIDNLQALSVRTESLPYAPFDRPYQARLKAYGGSGAGYTWSVIGGALPTGLSLTSGTPFAQITGTPTQSGLYQFTLQVQDSQGHSASRQYTLRVAVPAITTIAGDGTNAATGDGGPAADARLTFPQSLAADADGNLYIVDVPNHAIRRIDAATGLITNYASGVGRQGIAADAAGNLYAADANQVFRVSAADQTVTLIAGDGTQSFGGDGGPAGQARLSQPEGVAVDAAGHVYIADTQNHRVRKVDARTGIITTIAGNGSAGFSGDGGQATGAQLNLPFDVDVDAAGNLFVLDFANDRVRRIDRLTGVITTVAGGGPGALGDGGPATAATINDATEIDVDRAGNLFIADRLNHRLRRVDAATGQINTIAGDGNPGFQGDGGDAAAGRLDNPFGVIAAPDGSVFIADRNNFRIRKVGAP